MGYRSSGKIYLSDEALELLTDELKDDLKNWEKVTDNIWAFYGWKWYGGTHGYKEVVMWEDFMNMLHDKDIPYEFIRIGEEYEDIEVIGTTPYENLYVERSVEVY